MPRYSIFTLLPALLLCACASETKSPPAGSARDTAKTKTAVADTVKKPVAEIHFSLENCTLKLSEAAQRILKEYDPQFHPWERRDYAQVCGGFNGDYQCDSLQAPFAVIGDFNGDGTNDLVLSGRNKKNDLLLALLSEKDSLRVLLIEKNELSIPAWSAPATPVEEIGLGQCLFHRAPGTISSHWEKKTLELKNAAFEWAYCGKASSLYYFKDGAFHSYTLSD